MVEGSLKLIDFGIARTFAKAHQAEATDIVREQQARLPAGRGRQRDTDRRKGVSPCRSQEVIVSVSPTGKERWQRKFQLVRCAAPDGAIAATKAAHLAGGTWLLSAVHASVSLR